MIKINSAQGIPNELRKVRHFSSIVLKKLKSESISSENNNSFTLEELTDINNRLKDDKTSEEDRVIIQSLQQYIHKFFLDFSLMVKFHYSI